MIWRPMFRPTDMFLAWSTALIENENAAKAPRTPTASRMSARGPTVARNSPRRVASRRLQLIPSPDGQSQYALRANLQVKGVNVGRYIRLQVTMPSDSNDQVVLKMVVFFQPLYVGAA